jgi:muconolactone delta-isomerase
VSEFMVVCTFKDGTDMSDVRAVVAEERVAAAALQAAGRLTAVRLATPHGKVFLEVVADNITSAKATVEELPLAQWWDLEVYPLVAPA